MVVLIDLPFFLGKVYSKKNLFSQNSVVLHFSENGLNILVNQSASLREISQNFERNCLKN